MYSMHARMDFVMRFKLGNRKLPSAAYQKIIKSGEEMLNCKHSRRQNACHNMSFERVSNQRGGDI